MIGHGRSNPVAIKHGIRVAAEFHTSGINRRIEVELQALGAVRDEREREAEAGR